MSSSIAAAASARRTVEAPPATSTPGWPATSLARAKPPRSLLPELAGLDAQLAAQLGETHFADLSRRGSETTLDEIAGLLVAG